MNAGFVVQRNIVNVLGARVNFENQRSFLLNIENYLQQSLTESFFGYEFDPRDGPVCRANFRMFEEILDVGRDQYVADAALLQSLYDDIFIKLMAFGITLVDNQEFLDFFTLPDIDLNEFVKMEFFSANGAFPAMNVDELQLKLDELFFERVDLGLEQLNTPDLLPEATTCSMPTF